jgi:mono/diheme cytochrome c family protein
MKRILSVILAVVAAVAVVLIGVGFLHEPVSPQSNAPAADPAARIEAGRYLAQAGDCMACHTTRGGKPYAGGRAIATPFGDVFAPNITPDTTTGIGSWNADDFWRALHHGKSRDGRLLYPAFPYPDYTKVTRADADALFSYLQTVEPVAQANRAHRLRFPYDQQVMLAGWRALFFRPGSYTPDPQRSVEWNRGAYLVQGLGHCSACHTSRNELGASSRKAELGGGIMPGVGWYAPPLTPDANGGLGDWEAKHVADLLKTGVSARGTASGPMAEVVGESLRHLSNSDIAAMVDYLKSLPPSDVLVQAGQVSPSGPGAERVLQLGKRLYDKHCVECHKAGGEGSLQAYPPLAGNGATSFHPAVNAIRMVLNGGYPPSSDGNPRPFGMPPYGPLLDDTEVAAVVSYVRSSWGNRGGLVSPAEVGRYRGAPGD